MIDGKPAVQRHPFQEGDLTGGNKYGTSGWGEKGKEWSQSAPPLSGCVLDLMR